MTGAKKPPFKILATRGGAGGGMAPVEEWPVTVPVEWVVVGSSKEFEKNLAGVDVLISGSFTAEMGRAADRLKAIMSTGTGYEGIDPAAVPAGCAVTNSFEHEIPIAEWVMMTAMVLDKELMKTDRTLRSGSWEMSASRHGPFRELHGRTMGIIGLGHIGRRTAHLAYAFGMRCIATGRSKTHREEPGVPVEYRPGREGLEWVLRESDFVVLSVPLTPETTGLIGVRELSLMKPTSYLFNPARGMVVDEKALFEALKGRRIAGAGLDAWYIYPNRKPGGGDGYPANLPFWELDNVVMTPHNSAATFGTFDRRAPVLAENIDRLYRGQPLLNIVPSLSRI